MVLTPKVVFNFSLFFWFITLFAYLFTHAFICFNTIAVIVISSQIFSKMSLHLGLCDVYTRTHVFTTFEIKDEKLKIYESIKVVIINPLHSNNILKMKNN